MRLSVVAASREDDQEPTEALHVAALADRLGYGEVWLGEGPTWDAFVLATAVARATTRIAPTAGPVPVSVRGAAARVGRPAPTLAAWLPAAIDPDEASTTQLLCGVVGYFPVRGYADAGLDEIALVPATAGDPGGERTLSAPRP